MRILCRLEEIPEGAARGFTLEDGRGPRDIFVVRRHDQLYAYVNSCPHIGTPLEFLPHRFLTADGTEILCSTHGARFAIETGRCLAGPCRDKGLAPVPVRVQDGAVILADDAQGPAG